MRTQLSAERSPDQTSRNSATSPDYEKFSKELMAEMNALNKKIANSNNSLFGAGISGFPIRFGHAFLENFSPDSFPPIEWSKRFFNYITSVRAIAPTSTPKSPQSNRPNPLAFDIEL
jgi:hypothetical protein